MLEVGEEKLKGERRDPSAGMREEGTCRVHKDEAGQFQRQNWRKK